MFKFALMFLRLQYAYIQHESQGEISMQVAI